MRHTIELLAPAGTMENFRAAIEAGADAIYLGGKLFNARKFAGNFDIPELEQAVRIAHLHGVRVFVTVNIVIADTELAELEAYIKELERIQVDALIVQDLAVACLARKAAPSLPLHGSTQMTAADLSSVRLLASLGFTRVVLARELSIEEIAEICRKSPVEIEVFIHGALCVAYSGQCLMSSFIGGRSGNRGACAQPCRLPYELKNSRGETVSDVQSPYLMSLKDLNSIDALAALQKAGVASLKIEGRMKQSSYVYNVVSSYRRALDKGLGTNERKILENKTFNRGYTKGYLENRVSGDMATWSQPNNQSQEIEAVPAEAKKLPVYMVVTAHIGKPPKLTIYDETGHTAEIESSDYIVKEAAQRPADAASVRKQLERLGDTEFILQEVQLDTDGSVLLPASALNALRRSGIAALEAAILASYPRERCQLSLEFPEKAVKLPKKDGIRITVRTDEIAGIEAAGESGAARCIYGGESYSHKPFTAEAYQQAAETARRYGMEIWFATPRVIRTRDEEGFRQELEAMAAAKPDGIAAGSLGALELLKKYDAIPVMADWPLNIFNTESARLYQQLGCQEITLSPEMTDKQIRKTAKQVNVPVEILVHGRVEMMITEYCPIYAVLGKENKENCPRYCMKDSYALKDRKGEEFPLKTDQYCRVHILNSKELNMLPYMDTLRKSGASSLRIEARGQSAEYIRWAVQAYKEGLRHDGDLKGKEDRASTRGHFFKSVL